MNRRSFFGLLASGAVGTTLDLERLLWVPKPIVTVPAMPAPLRFHLRFHPNAFALVMGDAIELDGHLYQITETASAVPDGDTACISVIPRLL